MLQYFWDVLCSTGFLTPSYILTASFKCILYCSTIFIFIRIKWLLVSHWMDHGLFSDNAIALWTDRSFSSFGWSSRKSETQHTVYRRWAHAIVYTFWRTFGSSKMKIQRWEIFVTWNGKAARRRRSTVFVHGLVVREWRSRWERDQCAKFECVGWGSSSIVFVENFTGHVMAIWKRTKFVF